MVMLVVNPSHKTSDLRRSSKWTRNRTKLSNKWGPLFFTAKTNSEEPLKLLNTSVYGDFYRPRKTLLCLIKTLFINVQSLLHFPENANF